MEQLTALQSQHTTQCFESYVTHVNTPYYYLEQNDGYAYAVKAASCLLAPRAGDYVLVAASHNAYYIIAIIQQANPYQSSIEMHPSLSIQLDNNHSTFISPNMHFESQHFQVTSPSCHFYFTTLSQIGEQLQTQVQSLKHIAETFDQIVNHFSLKATAVHQWVSELSHLHTSYAKTIVANHYRLDCDELDMYAKHDAKIDGEQVFLA